jgi:hypothetical protein
LARWALIFEEYDFDVKHLAKIVNKDVDGLNRNSIANELDTTKTRWHGEIDMETMHDLHVVSFFCILVNGCHEVSCQVQVTPLASLGIQTWNLMTLDL